jgi:septal ring factor EnvC (AmiA/AmiB activator)
MDATEQAKWDRWCDARVENRVGVMREALADVFNEVRNDVAVLRREIVAVRDAPPPLIAPPDRRLAAALMKVGEELAEVREKVTAMHSDQGARDGALTQMRQQLKSLKQEIAEREERGARTAAATEKNLHAIVQMIANTGSALERLHCLVARVAVASENVGALRAVDEHKLANEEKPSATVLSLADLRHAS